MWLSINPPNCQRLRFSPTYNSYLLLYLVFIYHSIYFGTLTFLYSLLNVSTLGIISNNVATFRIIAKPF
nr:MAG TPA: hypothetical protein [Caudoviricetes sp.]